MATRIRYKRLGASKLPWSAEHPLVFHTLTSLTKAPKPYMELSRLLRCDAIVKPISTRKKTSEAFWSTGAGIQLSLGNTDEASGDEDWSFFVPLQPYEGTTIETTRDRRAIVAYDYDEWAKHGEVGWRPLDLIAPFLATESYVRRKFGMRSQGVLRQKRVEFLSQIAQCYTITDPASVRRLVTMQAQFFAGDDTMREQIRALLRARDEHCQGQIFWLKAHDDPTESDEPGEALQMQMMLHQPWNYTLESRLEDAGSAPELLLRGDIPLRAARFYLGPNGIWDEMPRNWPKADC